MSFSRPTLRRSVPILLSLAVAVFGVCTTSAETFYSVDLQGQQLVQVRITEVPPSVSVDPVGPLGINPPPFAISQIVLANENTILAITVFLDGSVQRNELWTIDCCTGRAAFLAVPDPSGVEGIAKDPVSGEIFISAGGQIGKVDLQTGNITPHCDVGNLDLDSLAFEAANSLYAQDRAQPRECYRIGVTGSGCTLDAQTSVDYCANTLPDFVHVRLLDNETPVALGQAQDASCPESGLTDVFTIAESGGAFGCETVGLLGTIPAEFDLQGGLAGPGVCPVPTSRTDGLLALGVLLALGLTAGVVSRAWRVGG